MQRLLHAAILVFTLTPVLAAQPCGPERATDDAVPHRNAATVAPGIRLANGTLAYAQTDLETAGRVMGLALRRVWRGDMTFDGPLGQGWTCEYLQAAWRDETTTDIHWHDAGGFLHTFVERDGAYRSPPGVYARATWDAQAESVSLRRADGGVLAFNPCGQLISIADRNGNAITLSYDELDQLATVTDDRGHVWEFVHDSGRIVQLIDRVWEAGGRPARVIEYEYADGNLARVKLPETSRYSDAGENRVTWEYAYDSGHRLAAVYAPREVASAGPARSEFEYDAQGRVIAFRDGDQFGTHLLRYTLTAAGKPLVRHIDPRGARVDYLIDQHGRSARREQYTKFWSVDETDQIDHAVVVQAANKVRASDPSKYTTLYDHNRGHQLTRIEHADGSIEQFSYPDAVRLARDRADDITGGVITVSGALWTPDEFAGGFVRLGEGLAEFEFYEVAGNTEDTLTVVSVNLVNQGWGANARFVVFTENPDQLAAGNLLEHRRVSADTEQADIVREWTYEPWFQQVRSETSARGHTTTWEFECDATGNPDLSGAGNITRRTSPEVTVLLPEGATTATHETTYGYNAFGQLTETVDATGSVELRRYYESGDQQGFLEEVITAQGELDLTVRFEYDKTGILTGQYPRAAFDAGAEADDFKTSWQVNELGQRWHEAGPLHAGARVEIYRYFDASGNETRSFRAYVTAAGEAPEAPGDVDDPNSFTKDSAAMAATWVEVAREFDLAGRVTAETSDAIAGNPVETVTWVSEYDTLGNLGARVSPLQNRTAFEYDERGLLWRRIEAYASAVEGAYQFDYSLLGALTAERTPLGHATTYTHDGHGRRVAVVDAEGNYRAFEFDAAGNQTREECRNAGDALLAATDWQYDELDRVQLERVVALDAAGAPIGAGFAQTRLTLDARGLVVQRSEAVGRTWTFDYDGAGRLIAEVDPAGNEAELTLDGAGQVSAADFSDWNQLTESAETSRWEADYNTLGKATAVRDQRHAPGFDTTVVYTCDGWGQLVEATDARGISVLYRYDLRSRPAGGAEDPQGVLFSGGWGLDMDRDDHVTRRKVLDDPEGTAFQVTEFDFDPRGRVTTVTRPDASSVSLAWDADSNLVGWEDENGVTVASVFDGRGLLTSRSVTGAAFGADLEEYEYDGAGRLRLSESSRGTELIARTEWTWNTLHRAESETLTVSELGSWVSTALWNERGELATQVFSDETEIEYDRDALSRVVSASEGSSAIGSWLWSGRQRPVKASLGNGIESTFTYEAGFAGPVARVQHARDGEVLWAQDRTHDLRGLPLRERRDHDGATGRVLVHDSQRRLAGVHLGADLAGSLLTSALAPADFGLLREFTYDLHGSRSSVTDTDAAQTQVHEVPWALAAGGMNRYASGDGALYQHDAAGRVTGDDASNSAFGWDYEDRLCAVNETRAILRDAQGRRVLEEEYDGETLVRRAVLVYGAGEGPIEEILLDGSAVEIGRVQYAHGPGGIIAERDGGWRYHHRDQDGSLIGLTDEAGRRVAEYDYLPFGAPVRRAIMLDIAPSEITECESEVLLSLGTDTHICVSVALIPGAFAGREFAIALPGAASDRYRTARVVSNDAGSITVHDPSGLIADAVLSENAGFVVYEAKRSASEPSWTYDSLSDTTQLSVSGAEFTPWLLGGWLTPDSSRPAYLEIIEVDDGGDWLRVRGDATGMSGSGSYRALPPVGAETDGGYSGTPGARHLYRGYRHDAAIRLASWPDTAWANRSGIYSDGERSYDPRAGRWMSPGSSWRNAYEFAPAGTLDQLNRRPAVPALSGTWSPSPACPVQARGQLPSRFGGPVLPGLSG